MIYADGKPMIVCPGCGERATAKHLQESKACMEAAKSFTAIYSVSKRKTVGKTTGRPKVLKPCPRCGAQVSATEARYGHEGCSTKQATATVTGEGQ